MDLSVFSAVAGGLQQAYQGAKALLELKVEAETALRIHALVSQLGDLSGKFLDARAAHLACQERTMDLEKEVARLTGFEADRARYALNELAPQAYVWSLRPEHQGEEPLHHLCCRCYAEAKKSILQFARQQGGYRVLACPLCQAEVRLPDESGQTPSVLIARRTSSRRLF